MILLWALAVAAFLVAGAAFLRVRRLSKRVERLMESYWDLRYELGQLQARLERQDPTQPDQPPVSPPGVSGAFIPVSSLKR